MSSTNNTIGEKVGAATGNTVGQESLLSEAQKVAGHAVEYAKATVGLGGHKAADSVQDATNNSQGGVTLGSLVNEARDLTAHALHSAQDVVAGGAAKAQEQAHTEQGKAGGVVDQARGLAGKALATAESYIAVAEKKADEVTSSSSVEDAKNSVAGTANAADKKVQEGATELNKKL